MADRSHAAPASTSDPTHSRLDPLWPPAAPPKGKSAAIMKNVIEKHVDTLYSILRVLMPIAKLPKNGPVFVTRFRDVQEVLDRPEIFAVIYAPMIDRSVGGFMLSHDGSEYNKDKGLLRSLMNRSDLFFVRETVGAMTDKCIDEASSYGTLEVVHNVSRRVPILLTGAYFGFPGPDLESMYRWGRATQYDMFHNQDMSGRIHDENLQAGHEMHDYLKNVLIPQRKAELEKNPDLDDVVSRLLRMKLPAEIGFNEERVLTNIMGLLVGGVETTSQAIVNILDQLFRRPNILAGAVEAARDGDDALVGKYCWEALRFNPINPFVMRQCTEPYRIASGAWRTKKIETGRVVLVATRSAMKDGREIPQRRKFRLDRPDYHYMHLGYGNHRCLGDHVSMVQVPEIVKRLLLRPNLRRAPGEAGHIDMNGGPFPESFSVCFDRALPRGGTTSPPGTGGGGSSAAPPTSTPDPSNKVNPVSNPKAEVAQTLEKYKEAFLTFKVANSMPYFNVPLMFIADAGILTFDEPEMVQGFLMKYVQTLQSEHYSRVELSPADFEVLNHSTVVAKFSVTRYDDGNKVIGAFGATYTFCKTDGAWKIAVAVLLAKDSA